MIRTLSTKTNLRSVPGFWFLSQENTPVIGAPSSDRARFDYDLSSAFQYASLRQRRHWFSNPRTSNSPMAGASPTNHDGCGLDRLFFVILSISIPIEFVSAMPQSSNNRHA